MGVLLIDSYDSFTNNLRALVEQSTGKQVTTVHNDAVGDFGAFFALLAQYEYIVIGPGPGHPAEARDVGVIPRLLKQLRRAELCVPVLGVCLGFQCLGLEFGHRVARLGAVRHGQVARVEPVPCELFGGAAFDSVRYHSLHVELEGGLVPLATCSDNGQTVLMAGKHPALPLYGVQYHPELVCSAGGALLIVNFDKVAAAWNTRRRAVSVPLPKPLEAGPAPAFNGSITVEDVALDGDAIDVCDHLHRRGTPFFLLNSASEPGTWSFIGLPVSGESEEVLQCSGEHAKVRAFGTAQWHTTGESVWEHTARVMRARLVKRTTHIPFVGGYVGFFSYEEGRHVNLAKCPDKRPDTRLVFIERTLAHDTKTGRWYAVSIRENDAGWAEGLDLKVERLDRARVPRSAQDLCHERIRFEFPDRGVYAAQFARCQELLNSGNLYELCLTTQLKVFVPQSVEPWELYKILAVHRNPSPFSLFMPFDDCVLLLLSPERFMLWTGGAHKRVEFRPIKGTVRKSERVGLAEATALLQTPKERGENLMIVDLIRHDLHGFSHNVTVDSLMAVEEYTTVFQLVSVILGDLGTASGAEVLRQSLPPGSMTGAPKKRSVELLQDIEAMQPSGAQRGIYSGVAGYWTVTDEGDWLVTIRSLYSYDRQEWRIGAGGAITVLSDCASEWEEMATKLESTCSIFGEVN